MQQRLQIQQCFTTDDGHCRQAHSPAGCRIEHPLRDLQESSFEVLLDAAAEQGVPIPGKGLVDCHNPVVPRVPRIWTSRDSILWVLRCRLVPGRPDPSRTGEGHAQRSSRGVGAAVREQDHFATSTRWAAPPLRRRCLNTRPAMNHVHC